MLTGDWGDGYYGACGVVERDDVGEHLRGGQAGYLSVLGATYFDLREWYVAVEDFDGDVAWDDVEETVEGFVGALFGCCGQFVEFGGVVELEVDVDGFAAEVHGVEETGGFGEAYGDGAVGTVVVGHDFYDLGDDECVAVAGEELKVLFFEQVDVVEGLREAAGVGEAVVGCGGD